jgi:transposase
MRAAVSIKSWIEQTPSVEQVRPPACAGCGVASRPVSQPIQVHGQGLLVRQVRGVLDVDGEPGVWEVSVRRYECQRCGAVMTVVPAEMLARRQYSAPSIALALYLWVIGGLSDRQVRERVCAWRVRGRNGRGWAQLYRWSRDVGGLFPLPRALSIAAGSTRTVLQHVLSTLRALCPPSLHGAPPAAQIFEGAVRMR